MWSVLIGISLMLLADDTPSATSAMSHARSAYELQRAGKGKEAENELAEAIRLDPRNPLFHSALAGLLVQAQRPDDAIRELETALDCHPAEPVHGQLSARLEALVLSRGAELAASGNVQSGLPLARQAAQRFPDSAPALQMLGFFQTKAQLNVEAVASYRRSLKLDPTAVDAAVGLAVAQAAAGMEADAMRGMEAGLAAHPGDPRFAQALGTLLLGRPEPSPADIVRAGKLFESALLGNPDLAESHYQLGVLALRAGDDAQAATHLETAARLDPADGRVHFALAKLFRKQHRQEDAKREMDLFSRSPLAARTQ